MDKLLRVVTLALAMCAGSAQADIIWVGIGPACTGFSVRPSIDDALALAEINGGPDEIRLTSSTSNTYLGPGSQLDLVDWSPATKGALTIAGGYDDCFGSQTNLSRLGEAAGPIIRVRTNSQTQSVVTLQNLIISGSTSLRGLEINGSGTEVVLENSIVEDNIAGVFVGQGATLTVDGDSVIQDNFFSMDDVMFGGGLRCQDPTSRVFMAGTIQNNLAFNGGNIYLGNGCLVELQQGAVIEDGLAAFGGGIFVDNFGVLESRGGASRVVIRDNFAEEGGGLYLTGGSGFATLTNTLFIGNSALQGAAIYAIDGGQNVSPRLTIDRAEDCPFLISCAEFESNTGPNSTVYARDTTVRIQRALFDSNISTRDDVASGNIDLISSDAFINRVGFIGNESYTSILTVGSNALIRQVTAVNNTFPGNPGQASWDMSHRASDVEVYNSIFADARGQDGVPFFTFNGACNLVESTNNWPSGTAIQGTAQFINAASGDLRQLPSSPGVDMCNANPGAPITGRDLEFQLAPVNEFTNQQGNPGQAGGLWDAGVDEVYSTIGNDEFTLTIARDGTGGGSVASDPTGIACGGDCSETYFQGTLITLTATPNASSSFSGWAGCPLPNDNQCLYAIDADRTITATFTSNVQFTLTIDRNGSGSGNVVSNPVGINCGDDCSEDFDEGTLITLTANPDPGSAFTGWAGCPLPNGNQCLNTIDGDRTINATFERDEFLLTVERNGSGEGSVVSTPVGISCGSDCSESFAEDTLVTLFANASSGSRFTGWIGCPLPNGNQCLNTIDGDRTITATFDLDEFTLTVEKIGSGAGLVTSNPAGIVCGADCSESFATDTLVTLTAVPDPGSFFVSWAGCPLPNGNECLNAVDSDRTISARFTDQDVIFSDRFQD